MSLFRRCRTGRRDVDDGAQPHRRAGDRSLPAGFTKRADSAFRRRRTVTLFSATPPGLAAGARREIYNVNVDGTGLTCRRAASRIPLHWRPAAPTEGSVPPVPFEDGSAGS